VAGSLDAEQLVTVASLTGPVKRRMIELLAPRRGHRILDIGCGPGLDTVALGKAVGPTGLVVGVDHDPRMIDAATDRARRAGLTQWVRHELADAAALPFEAGQFDACRSERLLQHVLNPGRVVEEIIRVTRPHGRVVVADTDWGSLSIDTDDIATERRVVRAVADALPDGYAGRKLLRLFIEHGLVDVVAEASPVVWTSYQTFCATSFPALHMARDLVMGGAITEDDWCQFFRSLTLAHARGTFFASGCVLLVSGVRVP
jgi:SAM-dependent methyltransferase